MFSQLETDNLWKICQDASTHTRRYTTEIRLQNLDSVWNLKNKWTDLADTRATPNNSILWNFTNFGGTTKVPNCPIR